MGRIYTATIASTAVTAQQDLIEILAPTDAIVVVHDWEVSQVTEAKDAEEEMLHIEVKRGVGTVTSGSGGTTPTAQPREDGDTAFGGVVEANNTTQMAAGTGTIERLGSHNWNVRVPYQKIYTPETRPVISPGNRLTIELMTTPADSITLCFTVTFEEIGG